MSPAFVTGVFGWVFVVRWVRFHLAALTEVRAEIALSRRTVGRRLVYLSLIPSDRRGFSEKERTPSGPTCAICSSTTARASTT